MNNNMNSIISFLGNTLSELVREKELWAEKAARALEEVGIDSMRYISAMNHIKYVEKQISKLRR